MALLQGRYKPIHPEKFKGDINNIIYRSSWELSFLSKLDSDPDVLAVSSEEVIIPYRDPVDGRVRRYFVDFWVRKKINGEIREALIEIKPYNQTQPPVKGKKSKKTMINEAFTYSLNQAKWEAARKYCKKKGWDFLVLTERELYGWK